MRLRRPAPGQPAHQDGIDRYPYKALFRREVRGEAYVSTEQSSAQEKARVPGADEHAGWPGGSGAQAAQRAQAVDRLSALACAQCRQGDRGISSAPPEEREHRAGSGFPGARVCFGGRISAPATSTGGAVRGSSWWCTFGHRPRRSTARRSPLGDQPGDKARGSASRRHAGWGARSQGSVSSGGSGRCFDVIRAGASCTGSTSWSTCGRQRTGQGLLHCSMNSLLCSLFCRNTRGAEGPARRDPRPRSDEADRALRAFQLQALGFAAAAAQLQVFTDVLGVCALGIS